ncbi:DsbA family protein [Streptomyces chartreusis]|uniref:DsbA family oxidoreductase n=1 Tax=Streptomyces chartreusis TaxID=1969 RepID=UPI0036C4DB1D
MAPRSGFDDVARVATAEGLVYDPVRLKPTNSHLALELLHHADSVGRHEEMSKPLYSAYSSEGRHIGRLDELVALAGEAGLDPSRVRQSLAHGEYSAAVDEDQARERNLGALSRSMSSTTGTASPVHSRWRASPTSSTGPYMSSLGEPGSPAVAMYSQLRCSPLRPLEQCS